MSHHADLPISEISLVDQRRQRSSWTPRTFPACCLTRLLAGLLLVCGLLQSAWAQACPLRIAEVHAARELPGTPGRPTAGWEAVTLPDSWVTRWPGHSGAVWYRLQMRADCSAAQVPDDPVALVVDSINLAGEIYLNDTLLWRDASLQEPMSRSWNLPRYWILPDAALRPADNALWIRVQGPALVTPGLGWVVLGPVPQMLALHDALWWSHRTIFVVNLVATLCIAGLFTGIWLLYRKRSMYGWFALVNFAWGVFVFNVVATDPWPFGDTVGVVRANCIAFMAFCSAYAIFIFLMVNERERARRKDHALCALTLGLSLLVACIPEAQLDLVLFVALAIHFGVFGLACMVPLLHAWRSRKLEHVVYALMGMGFVLIAARDMYQMYYLKPLPVIVLTPYVSLITMVVITMMLGSRVAASMRRTERFNVELTEAVEQACHELESTLDKEHQMALSNSRLQERLQFIHDLHDGFGSALVRAIVQAERTAKGQADASRHVSTLKSLRDDLRNVMDGGRKAEADTPATPAEWLAPTRHRFSTLFDEIDVDSHWSCPSAWPSPPSVALCLELTRLLEEALSNVLKHSSATEVEITLAARADGGLTLEVRDNGVGFDTRAMRSDAGGIGLHSMQARVDRLGGQLHIESRPGHSLVRASMGA